MIDCDTLLNIIDTKKLVSYIKENPLLWDKQNPSYRSRQEIDDTWIEISKAMMEETWDVITDEQRRNQVIKFKTKWKNLRDAYRKTTADAKRHSKSYVHADMLDFLDDHMKVRKGRSRTEKDSSGPEEPVSKPDQAKIKVAKLINLVKSSRALWDKTCKENRSRDAKLFAWQELARAYYEQTWCRIPVDEREALVRGLQMKWNLIRSNHRKAARGERKQKAYFTHVLSFLDNNYKPDDNDDVKTEAMSGDEQRQQVASSEPQQPFWVLTTEGTVTAGTSSTVDYAATYPDGEADRNFLLSCVPKMQRLSMAQKLDFQMYVLQYFVNLHQGDFTES